MWQHTEGITENTMRIPLKI